MPILRVNQKIPFTLNLQVVKAFSFEHDIFYIVVLLKKDTPLSHAREITWGTLSTDGTHIKVPEGAFQKAARLITQIDFKDFN
jgi:hypothetical protein